MCTGGIVDPPGYSFKLKVPGGIPLETAHAMLAQQDVYHQRGRLLDGGFCDDFQPEAIDEEGRTIEIRCYESSREDLTQKLSRFLEKSKVHSS